MSTATHLEQFRSLNRFGYSSFNVKPIDENSELRELWSDALAVLAATSVASVVVFEVLRILFW